MMHTLVEHRTDTPTFAPQAPPASDTPSPATKHRPAVGTTSARLKSIVEQVERAEADIADLKSDLKEIYAGAKSEGFDVKILKKIVALRKRDRAELEEEQAVLETYLAALGELPLFAGVGKGE